MSAVFVAVGQVADLRARDALAARLAPLAVLFAILQERVQDQMLGFERGVTLMGGFPFPICTPAHIQPRNATVMAMKRPCAETGLDAGSLMGRRIEARRA